MTWSSTPVVTHKHRHLTNPADTELYHWQVSMQISARKQFGHVSKSHLVNDIKTKTNIVQHMQSPNQIHNNYIYSLKLNKII